MRKNLLLLTTCFGFGLLSSSLAEAGYSYPVPDPAVGSPYIYVDNEALVPWKIIVDWHAFPVADSVSAPKYNEEANISEYISAPGELRSALLTPKDRRGERYFYKKALIYIKRPDGSYYGSIQAELKEGGFYRNPNGAPGIFVRVSWGMIGSFASGGVGYGSKEGWYITISHD